MGKHSGYSIAKRVKLARVTRKMSLKLAAENLGVSTNTVSQWRKAAGLTKSRVTASVKPAKESPVAAGKPEGAKRKPAKRLASAHTMVKRVRAAESSAEVMRIVTQIQSLVGQLAFALNSKA